MKRAISLLCDIEFDLIIVGGGIFGACAAWDAIQRGLSVALIEKDDFCNSTSANSFKLVHGGMRYLQHGDLPRIRQSANARRTLIRIAPHLVQPLPIVVPTYGHSLKGKAALRVGLGIYDLLTLDRNSGILDPQRWIPRGYCLSRNEVINRYPGLDATGLTGAGVFFDGQMYNPPRIVLAFLRTAQEAGAIVVNYVEARKFVLDGNRVSGVEAKDVPTGDEFVIRAKMVLNAAGPYAELLLAGSLKRPLAPPTPWSRDAYFVVSRPLVPGREALALSATTRDPDALLSRGGRHLFLVPWRQYTLVGVWHKVYTDHPDRFQVSQEEIECFIDEINQAYSTVKITSDDISYVNAGLILFGENTSHGNNQDLKFAHHSRLIDHAGERGIEGLVTLIGARFTTGPSDAVAAIDIIFQKLRKKAPPSKTHMLPLVGGKISHFESMVQEALHACPVAVEKETIRALVHNHGSAYPEIFQLIKQNAEWGQAVGTSMTLKAEIVNAVRHEMAITLNDVLLRRTDLGTGGFPGSQTIKTCAALMSAELQWSQSRMEQEIEAANTYFLLKK